MFENLPYIPIFIWVYLSYLNSYLDQTYLDYYY